MLLQIRDYIRREQIASIQQLTREFYVDEQALQPMLDVWIKKGVIEQCHKTMGCKSICSGCKTNAVVFYQICT